MNAGVSSVKNKFSKLSTKGDKDGLQPKTPTRSDDEYQPKDFADSEEEQGAAKNLGSR
ncbi:Uu.00g066420.m01.CDS01 [Anthostomella pinea]|uniref:Uu.00g066420.m01.CDS01 n=1 Tax=Anthostomella pinea TaxID=933095 RepID=A0AAI8VTW8_9PEZI|nr:Uu.00g066420.m01.CDS01 [Anthostomella pinea]